MNCPQICKDWTSVFKRLLYLLIHHHDVLADTETQIHTQSGLFNGITDDRYPKCTGTAGSLIGLDIDSSEAAGFDFAPPPRCITSFSHILMKNQSFTWNVIQPAVKYVSNKMFCTWSNPVPILKVSLPLSLRATGTLTDGRRASDWPGDRALIGKPVFLQVSNNIWLLCI